MMVNGKSVEVTVTLADKSYQQVEDGEVWFVTADGKTAGFTVVFSETFVEACPETDDFCYGRDSSQEAVETVVRKFLGGI